jgi:catalase
MVACAREPNAADHDRGQAGTLLREIWMEVQRAELGNSLTGHLVGGVQGEVPKRAFDGWNNVDSATASSSRPMFAAKKGRVRRLSMR